MKEVSGSERCKGDEDISLNTHIKKGKKTKKKESGNEKAGRETGGRTFFDPPTHLNNSGADNSRGNEQESH